MFNDFCMKTSVLRDQQYMFGVRSLHIVGKVLMNNELTTLICSQQSTSSNVLPRDATQSAVMSKIH